MSNHSPVPSLDRIAVRDALRTEMARRGLNASRLSTILFGRDEAGKVNRATLFYDILQLKALLKDDVRGLLRQKLGIELPAYRVEAAPSTPVRNAVRLYEQETGTKAQPIPPEQWARRPAPLPPYAAPKASSATPPRFGLVVGQDGRATLSLNLVDVDAAIALQALGVLMAANLIKPDEADIAQREAAE